MEDDSLLVKILDDFPTGIMIISNNHEIQKNEENNEEKNEVIFANSFIRKIFNETFSLTLEEENNQIKYLTKLKQDLLKFRKWDLNKLSQTTLYDSIFNNNEKDSIETYFSDYYMIYVKIQFIPDYILVSIDNFDDERKEIRKKIIKSISFQHLTTIHHELNNPLNGLINIIEQVNPNYLSDIKLSIFLIKRVIKKFILYTKCVMDNIQFEPGISSIINLRFILEKIAKNMNLLFDYKKIKLHLNETFNFLNNYLFKCDQYYIKEYFKNIFMYLYYIVPKDNDIILNYNYDEDYNPPKLILMFQIKEIDTPIKKESFKRSIDFYENIQIKETVKSLEVLKEILEKISKILKSEIFFDTKESTYIEVTFDGLIERKLIDQDSSTDSDISEFSKHIILKVPSFGNYDTFNKLSNIGIAKNTKKILLKDQCLSIQNTQANSATAYFSVNKISKPSYQIQLISQSKNSSNKNLVATLLQTKSLKKIDDVVESLRDPIIDNLKTPKTQKSENKNQSSFHQSRFNTYLKKESSFKGTVTKNNKLNESISRCKSITGFINNNTKNDNTQNNNKHRISKIDFNNSLTKKILQENTIKDKNIEVINDKSSKNQENDILVVDDEEFNLNCMKNLLKLEKNKADFAINGEEAVNKVIKNPNYKLIFMDIYMPIMDGLQASKKIENLVNEGKVSKKLIIIIISAHSQESIQDQMNNISIIKRFIQKPITRKKIQSVLSDFYY